MANNSNSSKDVRICFGVDPELKERLDNLTEWGDVKKMFTPITEQLVDMMEEHGASLIQTAIISEKLSLEQLLNLSKKSKEE